MKPFLLLVITIPLIKADLVYSQVTQPVDSDPGPTTVDRSPEENLDPSRNKKESTPATRFVPTEKVRADDAVSFPVDI